jgi:hypothetical protein
VEDHRPDEKGLRLDPWSSPPGLARTIASESSKST